MTSSIALSFADVHKRFGDRVALDGVTFEVERGEVFGLLGPNGAGKTTLIRLALDILRPDGGDVRLLGRPVKRADHDRLAYLPEERGLYRDAKVARVLAYLARLKGVPRREAKERALHWLDKVGLIEVANHRVEQLSKGMGQKVQIAAALVADPELAILDEPFSGLDPLHVEHVLDLIRERRERGQTTILSTHLMNRVEDVCDRMILMNRGRRVLYGSVESIQREHARPEVRVELEGSLPDLPAAIEDASAEADGTFKVRHRPELTPADLLEMMIAAGARVTRFEPVRVSIEEIFVTTVRAGEAAS